MKIPDPGYNQVQSVFASPSNYASHEFRETCQGCQTPMSRLTDLILKTSLPGCQNRQTYYDIELASTFWAMSDIDSGVWRRFAIWQRCAPTMSIRVCKASTILRLSTLLASEPRFSALNPIIWLIRSGFIWTFRLIWSGLKYGLRST